jgi:hypothetical protein
MWDGNEAEKDDVLRRYVEREPMWDGNEAEKDDVLRRYGLSENQCGMETVWGKGGSST